MSEVIRVGVEFDLGDAQQKLDMLRGSFETLKQSFQDAPNATRSLNQGLDRSLELVELIQRKIDQANKTGKTDDTAFRRDVTSGIDELSALSRFFSNDFIDVKGLQSTFAGLSSAVRKELDSVTRDIANVIKSNMKSLKASTIGGMTEQLLHMADVNEIFGRTRHVSGQVFTDYIKALIPNIMPAYLFNDYHQIRYGTPRNLNRSAQPADIIPRGFMSSFNAGGYVGINRPSGNAYMQSDYRRILRNMIMSNDAALRAAEATPGMLRYNRNGKASMAQNITPAMYDAFRQSLFHDFVRRASGSASDRIDIFNDELSDTEIRKVINRMTSSSTGRVLKAMETLDSLTGDSLWGGSASKRAYETLPKVAKRTLEEYQISKLNFGNMFQNRGDPNLISNNGRRVTLTESQNTRLLGLTGHHNEYTDKVLLISTDGYDKENKEHQVLMDQLLSGKPVAIGGGSKKYIAQNIHGTGEHTTIRMIEANAYEEVRRAQAEWAKKNGFVEANGEGANYWNNFVPMDYDFKTVQALRKHYDATGKGWSPGSVVHGGFADRNFGIISLSQIADDKTKKKLADGLAWFAEGVLPYGEAFQGRMGVSGKGTFHTLHGFKTMGEWANAVGLADEKGRFILPGPFGPVDLTNMHGMADESQIKNMQAYDNFPTSAKLNEAFTKQLQQYGMSALTMYDDAETRARGVGAQAMAFIKLSPKMQNAQIREYARRLQLLDTETGIEQYILGDPDNYLSGLLRSGEITAADPIIQTWAQAEKESLIQRIARGEWIDFGDQPSVMNQMINKSLISSILEMVPESRAAKLQAIRKAYEKKTGHSLNLSDDDLAGVFTLDKGKLVDLARPDEENVSVIRSPGGFGNFVSGKNYARLAAPIYEAFGLMGQIGTGTTGVYLSEADMLTLGDADIDGDIAKTVYGDIGEAVRETKELQDKAIASLGIVVDPVTKEVVLPNVKDFKDSLEHKRLYAEAAMAATEHMGSASSAGMRATMVDLYNPQNRDMLIAAVQSNAAYAATTAETKKATETTLTPQMEKALYKLPQWSKLPTKYSGFFNVTGQNDEDIPNPEDIATISVNGQDVKINLDALRKAEIDKINFRSAYNTADIGGLRAATTIAGFGVDKTRATALLQALDQHVGYGDAGEKTRALMKQLRYMKVMDIVDPMAPMNPEERKKLDVMVQQAKEEIGQQARKYVNGDKAEYYSFIKRKENEYGVSGAEDFLERGIHQNNLLSIFGADAYSLFPELFDSSRERPSFFNETHNTPLVRPESNNQAVKSALNEQVEISQEQATLAEAVAEAQDAMKGWQARRIAAGHQIQGHSVTSVTSMLPWMKFGDNGIVPFSILSATGREVDANEKYQQYAQEGKIPVQLFDENGKYGIVNQLISDIAGEDTINQDSVMGELMHAAFEKYWAGDRSKDIREIYFDVLKNNKGMLQSVGLTYDDASHAITGWQTDPAYLNADKIRSEKYARLIGYQNTNGSFAETSTRTDMLGAIAKFISGTGEEVVNIEGRNINVDGTQGAELVVNVPGWENTISRPDFITKTAGPDGSFIINDLKSSFSGGVKGLAQMMLYAKQYEDAAKKAWGLQEDGTFDLSKADQNNEYYKFGYVDDAGNFHSKISKLRALSANGGRIEADAQQMIDLGNGEQARLMDVLSASYLDAVKEKKAVFDNGGSEKAVSEYIARWIKNNKGIQVSSTDVANILRGSAANQHGAGNIDAASAVAAVSTAAVGGLQESDLDKLMAGLSAQEKYEKILDSAQMFKNSLTSRIHRNQEALSGKSYTDIMYDNNKRRADAMVSLLKDYREKSPDFQKLTANQQIEIDSLIGNENAITKDSYHGAVKLDYAASVAMNSKKTLESLRKANKWNNKYDETLAEYQSKIEEQEKQRVEIVKELADPNNTQAVRDELQASVDEIDKNLIEEKKEKSALEQYYGELKTVQNNQFTRRHDQMVRNAFGSSRSIAARSLNYRDSLLTQFENERIQIKEKMKQTSDPNELNKFEKQLGQTEKILGALNGTWGTTISLGVQFGNVIHGLTARLGRQLFHRAIQEIRKFVQEFNASMTEIQMITLKSDEEMQPIRSQTISRALNLRTSVSNVATTEAALYRQGLSDAEVASRTESIIKFATVAKLRVEDATKIITTALKNNLVSSAEEAMDALVALGDSAATTAAEIGKGMQKAAASAKVAGVSYAELTALLTIGTSNTQLGGTQIGTALNTIFSRMRRLTVNKYTSDINGESASANDVEAALQTIGVDLWENGAENGQIRSSFDILRDIAEVWPNISDAQKSIVTTAMAGTRMMNVFSTLMEGMDAETLDKYLGLAEGSEGITQSKYEIAMESLKAAIDEVKSSFDAVVESFTNSGALTQGLDYISAFLQQISSLAQVDGGKIAIILSAVAGGIVAISAALKTGLGGLGLITGLITAIGAIGVLSLFKPAQTNTSEQAHIDDYNNTIAENDKKIEESNQRVANIKQQIKEVQKLGEEYNKIGDQNSENNLVTGLKNLAKAFPEVSSQIHVATGNLSAWNEQVEQAAKEVEKLEQKGTKRAIADATIEMSDEELNLYNDKLNNITESFLDMVFYGNGEQLKTWARAGSALNNKDNVIEVVNAAKNDNEKKKILTEAIFNAYQVNEGDNNFAKFFEDYFGFNLKGYNDYDKFITTDYYKILSEGLFDFMDTVLWGGSPYDASMDYVTTKSQIIPYSKLANDKYNVDFLKQLTENMLNQNIDKFLFEDGRLNIPEVNQWLHDILTGWAEHNSLLDYAVSQYASDDMFSHFVKGEDGRVIAKFTDQNQAEDFVSQNGLSVSQIYDKNNKPVFQSADELVAAYWLGKEQENELNTRFLELLDNLDTYKSFDNIKDAYNGREGLLANLRTGIPWFDAAWENGDFGLFKATAYGSTPGKDNTRALVDLAWSALYGKRDIRNDPRYAGVYEAFKQFYGDIAEMIIDGVTDEGELDAYLFNKVKEIDRAYISNEARKTLSQFENNPSYTNTSMGYAYIANNPDLLSMPDDALEYIYDNLAKQGINMDQFYKDNPLVKIMLDAARAGGITEESFMSFLNTNRLKAGEQTSDYAAIGSTIFGEFMQGGLFTNVTPENMNQLLALYTGAYEGENSEAITSLVSKYQQIAEIMNLIANGETEKAAEAINDFNAQMTEAQIADITKYTKANKSLAENFGKVKKGGLDAAVGMMAITKSFQGYQDQVTAVANARGKSGAQLGSMEKQILGGILGLDEKDMEKLTQEQLASVLDVIEQETTSMFEADVQGVLDNAVANQQFTIPLSKIDIDGDGEIDASQIVAALDPVAQAAVQEFLAQAGEYARLRFRVQGEGDDAKLVAEVVEIKKGSGYNRSGGGGGGGGKSAIDKLLEKQQRSGKINEHELKMLQYRESFYEADSQLGNYGNVLDEEQNARERYAAKLQDQLDELKREFAKTSKETDDWYKLRDAILSTEEALEDNTNAMAENTRKIEQNRQAILKLHTDLEDTVKQEIETRLDEERQMLEGTASMEQTIVEAIRHRYTEEWDLIKKDVDKKKEALEEEKRLIDERLQARKDAEKTANDYEEMEELRAQYARISMDSTRTKEAAALREQIAEKQRENAWRIADEEAEATKQSIDEQIDAYDQFVSDGEEALNDFLENANNFADEVAQVLAMSQEQLIGWLQENDEEYKNSLENTQQTIVQGWEDTFKQMHGIVDLYWDQINAILSSKESFMEYMRQSSSYQNASEDMRKQMEYNWEQMYDDWFKAQDTSEYYTHRTEDFEGNGSGKTSNSGEYTTKYSYNGKTYDYKSYAEEAANKDKASDNSRVKELEQMLVNPDISKNSYEITQELNALKAKQYAITPQIVKKYSEGGFVDYTGFAVVHGTPARPESFLDAEDTALVRRLLDAFGYISLPTISRYDSSSNASNNSIGDVYVTINEAELKDDADFEEVAERVGELFAKNLEKQGFSTVNYNL